MKNSVKRTLSLVVSLIMLISCFSFSQLTAAAADGITAEFAGWFETAYAEWLPVTGAGFYEAYVKASSDSEYEILDDELVRQYDTYIRADAVGLPAGSYDMKIVAYDSEGGSEIASAEKTGITVSAYDRSGSAFSTVSTYPGTEGLGAYNYDGSLKSDAEVFYVTADTAATITMDVVTSKKGAITSCTGIQAILDAYQKGYDTTPVAFRIIGTVTADDVDYFSSSSEGLQIKGNDSYSEMPMTFEGIGNDAAVSGFGFLIRNSGSVEFRNFAILDFMDDGISMDTDNCNVWVHNMDIFYGQAGSSSDQKKGDGTVDVKANSQYVTVSYNHFWDSGKSSLCGMKDESGNNYITYHHNWFDHSDSRHPRVRTMSVHIYNNFYDGNSKYGSASAVGASLFVEQNYYRSCRYPVLIGGQGSEGGTTLSGETGAPIKMYGNIMTGSYTYIDYSDNSSEYDGYKVSSRSETIPSTVTAAGGTYNNFDTENSEYLGVDESDVDSAADVPGIVMSEAGRCNGGDIFYTFDDSTEDTNSDVITELKSIVTGYTSSLRVIGGAVDSSACDSSADPSSATGVDDNTTYTDRDAANAADAAALSEEGDTSSGGSGDSGGGTSGGQTSYDLELTGSDVSAETISSTTTGLGTDGAFTIYAASDKEVTINGEEIRLGGGGTITDGTPVSRVIEVTLEKAGTITLTATSSSSSTERTLLVSDGSTTYLEMSAPGGSTNTMTTGTLQAGTYYIYSTSGGINVSFVGVTYASTETSTETTTEEETESSTEEETESSSEESSTEETSSEETSTEEESESSSEESSSETTTESSSGSGSETGYDLTLTGSDVSAETISSTTTGLGTDGAFTIYAAEGKTVTINGEEIKLGGGGTITDGTPVSRVIAVTLAREGTITVTATSSSSDTERTLLISDGTTTYSEITAPAGSANTVTTDTLQAGTYYIYSKSGGINVSFVGVTYTQITGDVDCDGDVDTADAAIVLEIASGLLSEDSYDNADCDNDGDVTVLDAIWILKNQTGSGSSTESTTEAATESTTDEETETTTEKTETTTEASGESGSTDSAVSSVWTAGDSTTPSWLDLGSLTAAENSREAFSDIIGSAFSYAVSIAADGTFTVTPTSAGTLTVYIAGNNNSADKGTVTAEASDGTTLGSYSLPSRQNASATPFTITVSEDYVGKEITFTVSYASLLFMIS